MNLSVRLNIHMARLLIPIQLVDDTCTNNLRTLLPLSLVFNDLFGREKFAHLPQPLTDDPRSVSRYGSGDIVYWPSGPDISIYYGHGESYISDGVILLGHVANGLDSLKTRCPLHASLEQAY